MTTPVLPPDVPIVDTRKIQPQWWRWFRDVNDAIDANAAAVVAAQATRLPDVALTTGNNVVAHGFGSTPTSWWPGRPRGAFPALSGGSYPNISPPRASASFAVAVSRVSTFTMQFTPADGATLVALVGSENSSNSISSIVQTGVSWSKILGPFDGGSSDWSELWVGSVSAGAATTVTVTFSGGLSAPNTSLTVAEVPEISSVTPTSSGVYKFPGTSHPDLHYDSSQQFGTPPVPNAGDLVITIVHAYQQLMPVSTGWPCIAANGLLNSAHADTLFFAKVAQESEHQPFRGISYSDSANRAVYQVCFPTSLTASGGTIPHGLREVSIDDTNLTVESISNVTVDLFFK